MFLKKIVVLSSVVLLSLCISSAVFAAPYSGLQRSLKQPNGTSVDVKVFGDEFYQRVESVDGYTLIRDNRTNWICYAKLDSTNTRLVSTGVKCISATKPRTLSLNKGIKESSSIISSKVNAEKSRLKVNTNFAAPASSAQERTVANASTVGIPKNPPPASVLGLTILIDFPDDIATIPHTTIDNMINQRGYSEYGNNGSVMDYFHDMSRGQFTYKNIVTTYYRAKNPKSYYDVNDSGRKVSELINEALTELDKTYDFSNLTTDGSQWKNVISLNVLYAGSPTLGWGKGLWPHSDNLGNYLNEYDGDGVRLNSYTISDIPSTPSIGTVCHEVGHMILGYDDTYDYGGESSGTGNFDLMSGSPDDRNPLPIDPYMRNIISGFGNAMPLDNTKYGWTIPLTPNSVDSYIFRNPDKANEYFMIESISKTGRRAEMPGSGLLIWHIDEYGSKECQDMTPTSHYKVSVEQADGLFQLEKGINHGDANDFFSGIDLNHKNFFTPNDIANSLPRSTWWDGSKSTLYVTDIDENGTQFKFNPGPTRFGITGRSGKTCRFSWSSRSDTRYAIYSVEIGSFGEPTKILETTTAPVTLEITPGSHYFVAIIDSLGERISAFSNKVTIN